MALEKLYYFFICIISFTTSKKRTKMWTIDFSKEIKPYKIEFSWKEDSSVPIGWNFLT